MNYKYLPTFDNKPVYTIFWSTKILLLPYISSRRYYILLHRVVDSLQNLVSRITFVPATTTAYFKFFIFLGRYSTCLKILVFLLLNNKVGFGICVRTTNHTYFLPSYVFVWNEVKFQFKTWRTYLLSYIHLILLWTIKLLSTLKIRFSYLCAPWCIMVLYPRAT